MDMTRAGAVLLMAAAVHALPARAAEPRLVCFGVEPSWSLRFDGGGRATLAFPDGKPVEYRGRETRLDFLKERAWRGTPARGGEGRRRGLPPGGVVQRHHVRHRAPPVGEGVLAGRTAAGGMLSRPGVALSRGPPGSSPRPDPAAPLTVRFANGRASGFSGCNRFNGGFMRDGDTLTVGPLAAAR